MASNKLCAAAAAAEVLRGCACNISYFATQQGSRCGRQHHRSRIARLFHLQSTSLSAFSSLMFDLQNRLSNLDQNGASEAATLLSLKDIHISSSHLKSAGSNGANLAPVSYLPIRIDRWLQSAKKTTFEKHLQPSNLKIERLTTLL